MKLISGQVWRNEAGTKRTLAEVRGLGLSYFSGGNQMKQIMSTPWKFSKWICDTNAVLESCKVAIEEQP